MKIKKIQDLKEKGITLIALVVTIIILLILAGVTLNMAMNGDGLFSRARNAADKYKKAQKEEQDLISEIGKEMNSEYVGAFVTGYNPVPKTEEEPFTIGLETSGINKEQKFITEEMEWRIWDYDGTVLRLISARPTTQTLELKGVNGYNNGVWAMNEICRQCYSTGEEGVTVRNLRRSDIEKVSNYDYTKYKHNEDNNLEIVGDEENEENLIHYGESKAYTDYYKSPIVWSKYDSTWNYKYNKITKKGIGIPSCEETWEQELGNENETKAGDTTSSTEFKQTFYAHNFEENEFKNHMYYDMIFKNNEGTPNNAYWLAGRFVNIDKFCCNFGLHKVYASNEKVGVSGNGVLNSSRVC